MHIFANVLLFNLTSAIQGLLGRNGPFSISCLFWDHSYIEHCSWISVVGETFMQPLVNSRCWKPVWHWCNSIGTNGPVPKDLWLWATFFMKIAFNISQMLGAFDRRLSMFLFNCMFLLSTYNVHKQGSDWTRFHFVT